MITFLITLSNSWFSVSWCQILRKTLRKIINRRLVGEAGREENTSNCVAVRGMSAQEECKRVQKIAVFTEKGRERTSRIGKRAKKSSFNSWSAILGSAAGESSARLTQHFRSVQVGDSAERKEE